MNKLIVLACCTAISLTSYVGPTVADSSSIKGVFEVEATLRFDAPECSSGELVEFGVNPFEILYTFNEGGTMSEFGTRSPPGLRTPGHGVWKKKSGKGNYSTLYTFRAFDSNGLTLANMDVTGDMLLTDNSKSLSGVARLVYTDISGNVAKFCAVLEGQRVEL